MIAALAASACDGATPAQPGPPDGAWSYRFIEDQSRTPYTGTVRVQGGRGVNRVEYVTRGARTVAEFDVAVRPTQDGLMFVPSSEARYLVRGNSISYWPDTFSCRWDGPALMCNSVDARGLGSSAPFPMTR